MILERHPLIGRPAEEGRRELVNLARANSLLWRSIGGTRERKLCWCSQSGTRAKRATRAADGRDDARVPVKLTINGDPVEVALKSADRLLIDVLREDLKLTGTKHGCGIGACGTAP